MYISSVLFHACLPAGIVLACANNKVLNNKIRHIQKYNIIRGYYSHVQDYIEGKNYIQF